MHAAVGDLKLNAELSDLMTRINHSKEVVNAFKKQASSKFMSNLKGVSITLIDQASKERSNVRASILSFKKHHPSSKYSSTPVLMLYQKKSGVNGWPSIEYHFSEISPSLGLL